MTTEQSKKDKFSELISSEKPLLVDFSAEWCGPCKMLAPVLKELSGRMGEQLRIIKVDIDKHPALADKWKIQGVPTLILFQSGKMLWRQSGVVPASYLEKVIKEHISK